VAAAVVIMSVGQCSRSRCVDHTLSELSSSFARWRCEQLRDASRGRDRPQLNRQLASGRVCRWSTRLTWSPSLQYIYDVLTNTTWVVQVYYSNCTCPGNWSIEQINKSFPPLRRQYL